MGKIDRVVREFPLAWLLRETYVINGFQYNVEFLVLSLLGLCHLGHIQFLARQLFPQLVQYLTIVHVLVQLLYNNALISELIVNPIDKYPLQLNNLRIVYRLWVDNGTLLVLSYRL